jgi:hypothetical protein
MGLHLYSYHSWVGWFITLCVPSAQLTGVWESLHPVLQLKGGLVKLAVWMEYP